MISIVKYTLGCAVFVFLFIAFVFGDPMYIFRWPVDCNQPNIEEVGVYACTRANVNAMFLRFFWVILSLIAGCAITDCKKKMIDNTKPVCYL